MLRALNIVYKLEQFSDTIVTLMAATVITMGADEALAIAASVLSILYWIPKIKREINLHYRNSFRSYIKKMFQKKTKYDK